jgi:hypothetical protein
MSAVLFNYERFEWDRYIGDHMTPVDAVQNARSAGQSFDTYAREYATAHPVEDVSTDDLANGMAGDMLQAAHNLANFRVTGSPALSPHSATLLGDTPDDPETYYAWIETADESEILERITGRKTEAS